jgi:adenosine kinase
VKFVVTGSIATDHLMVFPGRFNEQLIDGHLDRVSLSFLVDELEIRRGGVAANIAYGLGCLGFTPLLVGSVGEDFDEYRMWLNDHNVDTSFVHVSSSRNTARFVCTTDADHNQIASFYSGAMDEAAGIDLTAIIDSPGDTALVVVSPNQPEAMVRHTNQCRQLGVPFVADPSQQLARMAAEDIRELVDGAALLFTNEYEAQLLVQKTGWRSEHILARVGTWITTRGANGATITTGGHAVQIAPVAPKVMADPTGVGDAFRAGYLAGMAWQLDEERSAQLGSVLATLALETVGTQEYRLEPGQFIDRFTDAYGQAGAAEAEAHLLATPAGSKVAAIKENV